MDGEGSVDVREASFKRLKKKKDLKGIFVFLYYVNGLTNSVNLCGCKCRFYKLLGVSVINETSRGFLQFTLTRSNTNKKKMVEIEINYQKKGIR